MIDQARDGSDELATRTDLERLGLRMRLHIYAVAIVVITILATLELLPLWLRQLALHGYGTTLLGGASLANKNCRFQFSPFASIYLCMS